MPIETKFLDAGETKVLLKISGIPEMKFGAMIFQKGNELLQKGVHTMILDLVDLALIPMDGLGMLNTLHQQAAKKGGKLILVIHSPNLKLLLRSTSLSKVMTISDNLEEVLEAEPDVDGMDHFIHTLNEEQQFWYLCAMANMIIADGQISPDEIAVAESVFQMISLDSTQAENVQSIFQTLQPFPLGPVRGIDKETGVTILQTLTLIAISDQSLLPEEIGILRHVCECLGYEDTMVEEMIHWGNAQLA